MCFLRVKLLEKCKFYFSFLSSRLDLRVREWALVVIVEFVLVIVLLVVSVCDGVVANTEQQDGKAHSTHSAKHERLLGDVPAEEIDVGQDRVRAVITLYRQACERWGTYIHVNMCVSVSILNEGYIKL